MKQLTILAMVLSALFMFSAQSMAQQVNVPTEVKQAFRNKFPNALNVDWGKESPTVFEAEFSMNGKEISANFDEQGRWKETEKPISNSDVPNAVIRSLHNHYQKADLKKAYKVSRPGQTVYELEVKMKQEKGNEEIENEQGENEENEENGNENGEMEYEGHHTRELVFTANGKLINQSGEESEEGGD